MVDGDGASVRARWARLRFMIIGSLLANPPDRGELQERIQELADKLWEHPTAGKKTQFSFSTIERWFYLARGQEPDPFGKLVRKTRKDAGAHPTISVKLSEAIASQYRDHRTWQYKLHYDNLVAVAKQQPELGPLPSLSTVTRYMKDHGMVKHKRRKGKKHDGLVPREKRSWEVKYPNQLWHLDFHVGSRRVLRTDGSWVPALLLGILDDNSRLACHVQWYLAENTENLVHGLCQAFQKRDLPRALLTDGGSAMKAGETRQGLERQSICHDMTLPNTPETNAKQENFWTRIETRLLPMLEGVENLSLRLLNEATQAWVEYEYNRKVHSETGQSPLDRFLEGQNLGRSCPDSATLHAAFRIQATRAQRRSDGTISVERTRFELPSRFRALRTATVRYARWDLSTVDLLDPRDDSVLCTLYPLDRQRNAQMPRRTLETTQSPSVELAEQPPRASGPAPLLRELMSTYSAHGLPPAYIPKDEVEPTTQESSR